MLGRLRDKITSANGRKYCERCSRCAQCDKAIKGRFISDDLGDLYHVDCAYEKLVPNCRACGLKVVDSIYEKIICSKTRYWNEILCGHHTQEELRRCSSCQRLQPLCLSATVSLTRERCISLMPLGIFVISAPQYMDALSGNA